MEDHYQTLWQATGRNLVKTVIYPNEDAASNVEIHIVLMYFSLANSFADSSQRAEYAKAVAAFANMTSANQQNVYEFPQIDQNIILLLNILIRINVLLFSRNAQTNITITLLAILIKVTSDILYLVIKKRG